MAKDTIIITGADGGLGSSVTSALLKAGYMLRASAMHEESVERLKSSYPEHYGNALTAVIADLGTEEGVKALLEGIPQPSGLVHLAGGYKPGNAVSDYSNDDFSFLMNLNARPTFLLLKHLMPSLKALGKGSIVTIGAKPALHPVAANAVYTASKSAVIALTMAAAEEGRPFNVRANCIIPAALQTPGNLSWASKEQFETFTPLQDIADTILFLMSDEGRGITGTTIPMYHKIAT